MNKRISTKDMIIDLCSMCSYAKSYSNLEKNTKSILSFILKEEYCQEESESVPTIKEISQSTGLGYSKVRLLLRKFYMNLVDGVEEHPIQIRKTRVEFSVPGYDNHIYIKTEDVIAIPRKGESFYFNHFRAHLGTSIFYVKDVIHEFHDETHIISIRLKPGKYNPYWELRKDQAYRHMRCPMMNIFN